MKRGTFFLLMIRKIHVWNLEDGHWMVEFQTDVECRVEVLKVQFSRIHRS